MKFNLKRGRERVVLHTAVILVGGILLGGCVPSSKHKQALKVAAQAEHDLQAEKEGRASETATLKAALESVRSAGEESTRQLELEVERLKGESEAAAKALEELKAEFEAYKRAYRVSVRENANGLTLDELRTLTGKVYKGVKVRTLDARTVSFIHDSGSGSIGLANLEAVFHPVLGYDPRDAEEQAGGEEGGRIVRGAGDVEKISGNWDRLKQEAAAEKSRMEAQTAVTLRKRDAIVAEMKRLNAEIVHLDNAIIRAGAGGGSLRERKKQLEAKYSKLGAQLSRLD